VLLSDDMVEDENESPIKKGVSNLSRGLRRVRICVGGRGPNEEIRGLK
jgi:hypothetical protein